MKRIIGIGKPKPPPPTISETIDTVDRKADGIRSKISQIDAELIKLREQMKNVRPGGAGMATLRGKAQALLRRKKQYESLEQNLVDQSFTMEQATAAMHTANTNAQIVTAMKKTVKDIQKAYKAIDIDEIDEIRDKMEDVMEKSEEIQSALTANSLNVPDDIDDATLEAELDALGDEIVQDNDKSYLDVATEGPSGSTASTAPIKTKTSGKSEAKNGITVDEFGLPVIQEETPKLDKCKK